MTTTAAEHAEPAGQPGEVPNRMIIALKGTLARAGRHDTSVLAAGVAFRIFLSLFPGAAAAVGIFSLVVDESTVIARLEELLANAPQAVQEVLSDQALELASGTGAGFALVAGIAGGLWAASSSSHMLMIALNRAWGVPDTRNVVVKRLIAIGLVLILFAGIGALLALVILGPQVQRLVLPEQLLGGAGQIAFGVLQFLGAVVILVVVFELVFRIGPDLKRSTAHFLTPGAVLAVVGWLLLSAGLAIYTQTSGNYAATYATLAGVVITMVWLQLSMTVLLLGAELDAELEELAGRDAALADGAGQALLEPTLPDDAPGLGARAPLPGAAVPPSQAGPRPGPGPRHGHGPVEPLRGDPRAVAPTAPTAPRSRAAISAAVTAVVAATAGVISALVRRRD